MSGWHQATRWPTGASGLPLRAGFDSGGMPSVDGAKLRAIANTPQAAVSGADAV